ncbi:F420-non-reducing hydrogenase iron-sulfur subunit [Thermanaeromonas toyohensis ToBE]|uniref:F420-non-reducing hydrogenase iron-sulfur subunit n=1 Tax=Thermanaeromonas toyohensis ToBE TaxID=698762 RepID=A0A1W1VIA1_9FIRM|nr:hydrogenase iron-sulfur subunit [Thermanaeromonas toyohensis]SMB93082.1 F420-non-reducing hydrogenase iron-sulfur subunit [Thermanaeromonas toyohensis ToBE]
MGKPLIGFFCRWCGCTAADLVAMSRRALPKELVIIPVPCSGRVEPELILSALRQGAAGVLVVGCPRGDCHYGNGNRQAEKRAALLKSLLRELNWERRFRLELIGPQEADRLLEITWEMVASLKETGI